MIDRAELQDAAQKAFPSSQLLPSRESSWQIVAEAGWIMVALGEELGGLGLGRGAAATLHLELGRVLSTAPLMPALLAIEALVASGDGFKDRQGWIERVCAGELISLSFSGSTPAGSSTFGGVLGNVPDADIASHVLVFAPGIAALVPLDGADLLERPFWDQSRRFFDVDLKAREPDPDLLIAQGEAADRLALEIQGSLALGLAADSLGGANAVLDMTVDYLKTRRQFERPLAMFQALKHRCADLKVHIAAAEALLWSRAQDAAAVPAECGALKALASDVYRMVSEEAIQLHGGIGLTAEHPCHLFMKRAMLNLQLGGTTDFWREQMGREALARLVD